jgi:hypothetical protein
MATHDLTASSSSTAPALRGGALSSPRARRIAIGTAIVLLGLSVCLWRLSSASATPPAPAPSTTAQPAPATAATAAPSTTPPATTQIVFTTVPPANATVTWGKTVLGRITPQRALYVTRPRDSGPLDVTVRAVGYLPVHTRAHTFADTRISVKLTRPEDKQTLFGYRAPIDAGLPEEEEAVPPGTSVGVDMQQPPL